jgi:ammonium transporter Rh
MNTDTDKNSGANKNQSHLGKYWLYYLFITLEAVMIILYGLFTTYGHASGPKYYKTDDTKTQEEIKQVYPFFQDVHVMIFVGFGFLMTFLRKYSWSSVAKNFLMAAWAIQLGLLSIGFWKAVLTGNWSKRIDLTIHKLVDADFCAGSILISFGAVLGKLHFTQYLAMATIQIIIYGLNMNIGFTSFVANDIGGSMTIHLFGAYYGLTVALMIKKKHADGNIYNSSDYFSNVFSMIGTLFLWMFWPSFNGALAVGNAQHRCIMNTILSLCGSCVMVFLLTPFFRSGKFHMENILNATLAGGVIIGSTSDIIIDPWVAFIIGCGGGVISLIGFEIIGPFLNRTIGLQDTCGVHSLHGLPGLFGGLISAIIAGTAKLENYGDSYYVMFPQLENNKRSPSVQAGYQLATIAVSLGLAIVSGIITGLILKSPCFPEIHSLFDDNVHWEMEEHGAGEHDVLVVNTDRKDDHEYPYIQTEMALTAKKAHTIPTM